MKYIYHFIPFYIWDFHQIIYHIRFHPLFHPGFESDDLEFSPFPTAQNGGMGVHWNSERLDQGLDPNRARSSAGRSPNRPEDPAAMEPLAIETKGYPKSLSHSWWMAIPQVIWEQVT